MNKQILNKYRVIFICVVLAVVFSLWFLGARLGQNKIRNIVLISIDTCRADYLSCYGYPSQTTPNIDAIAAEGIRFENVISPISMTLPAHGSMLTGTNPLYHGVHDNEDYQLGKFNTTLAEILKDEGFTTAAVVSAFVLDSQFGIDQGFDTFDDRLNYEHKTSGPIKDRKGSETSRLAVKWLEENRNEKFFLFLHYFDPHVEYQPPEPFASQYAHNLYAGEIAYTDHCIAQVITKLKELGIYDSSLIIITADHGEMLGQHGEITHGYFIYQGNVRVPLIFKLPGKRRSKVITKRVGLIDIVPTVCGLLDIEAPSGVKGMDLSHAFAGKKLPERQTYLYCESFEPTKYDASPLLGIVTDQYKYIQTARGELYDLIKDPAESDNLLATKPKQANLLKGHLELILKDQLRKNDVDNRLKLNEQALDKLESLGYVAGSVKEDFRLDQDGDDPKDFIDFHNLYMKAGTFTRMEMYKEARALCKQMISQKPDFWGTYHTMGRINAAQDNVDEAIGNWQEAVKLKPDHYESYRRLGTLFSLQGKTHKAIVHFQKVLQINPDHTKTHNDLANELKKQGKADEAISHYRRALQIDPDFAEAHNNLGVMLKLQGNIKEAIQHYQKVLQIDPDITGAYYNLANIYIQQDKIDLAIENYKQILTIEPDSAKAMNSLAWILAAFGEEEFHNPQQAIKLAERACELTNYKEPSSLDTLSVAYAAADRFDEAIRIAEKALNLTRSTNDLKLVNVIQKHLKSYKAGQPWREQPE